jgi:hypothetical protein
LGENSYFKFCTTPGMSILIGDPNNLKTYCNGSEREDDMYFASNKSTTVSLMYVNLTS